MQSFNSLAKEKSIVCSSSSSSSNLSRWDTILAFLTSPDDNLLKHILTDLKENTRRRNNEENQGYEEHKILEFKKMGLRSLEGVQCFVQREIEQLDLNIPPPPPPPGLLNEVDMPVPKVDGSSCSSITVEEGFIPWKTRIPKRRRTMPKEEDYNTVYHPMRYIQKTSITFQGSCSTSLREEKLEEHCRIIHNGKPKKQKVVKPASQSIQPAPQLIPGHMQEVIFEKVDELHRILHEHRQPKKDRSRYNDKPKKQKVVKPAAQLIQPAPQLIPSGIEEAILGYGGTNITWLSEKLLYESDTRKSQNRLFLPSDCFALLERILTDDEKKKADVSEENVDGLHTAYKKKDGLKVKLIGPNLRVWDMDFKYWPSLNKRVFAHNWYKVVADLELVPKKHKVQIWCFRCRDMKLCFAINIGRSVPAPPEPEIDLL